MPPKITVKRQFHYSLDMPFTDFSMFCSAGAIVPKELRNMHSSWTDPERHS